MEIDFDAFLDTLPIMGMGMLGIFVVTGVIILVMVLLNKFTSNPKEKSEKTKKVPKK